jgi:hypothetical protein
LHLFSPAQVQAEFQELPVQLVLQEPTEQQELLVQLVPLAQLDHKEQQAHLV